MPKIKLVISDLHLADGHPILDGFGDLQQSALEGLLNAASGKRTDGFPGKAEDVELIINGDCFDFLTIPPYMAHGTMDASTALGKLETIFSAHHAFFETLKRFVTLPGRHVTFLAGNHDIELVFEEVQARICEAIFAGTRGQDQDIHFCHTSFYRPTPDVYIEHGSQYDFWNHASGIWDEQGQPFQPKLRAITLPIGTQYFQRASHPVNVEYPYFDHFEPPLNSVSQIALLCLLNPQIVIETAHRTMQMLSYSRQPLAGLKPGEEQIPARLFEHAMIDFAAFQQDMLARKPDWTEPPGQENTQANTLMEFVSLRDTLTLQPVEAVTNICIPSVYQMGESVASGMRNVLHNDSTLRYAIAGHTHMDRVDSINNGSQVYLNTATWTTRYALPEPGEITPELVKWLRRVDWNAIPLRDMTRLVFALIYAEEGTLSRATLCAWEGGAEGTYRELA